jgi:hypothetical protein
MMFFLKKMSTVALAAMTIALIPAVGRAETPAEISPKALSILQRAHDFLKKEHFYSFQANISADEVLPPAFKIEYHSVANFKVRRPNGVFVEFVGDRRTANFYYDGFQLTLWDKVKNVYATIAAPSTIDETISLIDTKYNLYPAKKYPGYVNSIPLSFHDGQAKLRFFAGPFEDDLLKNLDQTFTKNSYNPYFIKAMSLHGWFTFISEPFSKVLFLLLIVLTLS